MKKYIGTKMIEAEPMTKFEYNKLKDRNIPGEDQEGYKVGYFYDMTKTDKAGYESWSPKTQFEEAYRESTNLNFGIAIELAKKGFKVARQGWNGKGMYLEMQNVDENSKMGYPYIYLKTVDNKFVPWNPNNLDMLSEDWVIVK